MKSPGRQPYPFSAILAGHIAIAASCAGLAIWAASERFELSTHALPWASGAFAIPVLCSEPVRRATQPRVMGHANRVTLLRASMIGWIAAFGSTAGTFDQMLWVTVVATLALAMDGLDGWIARLTDSASAYGAQLDMEFDAILMLVLSWLAVQWHQTGPWILVCGLARYAWIAAHALLPWFRRPLPESFRRKAACVVGIIGLTLTVSPIPGAVLWGSTATVALAGSFAVDLVWLVHRRHLAL